MAHDPLIVSNVVQDDTAGTGTLFAGLCFWIGQRVPRRSFFVQLVEAHGGDVVKLEKEAHVLIADHARKGNPPASLSYTWLEACLRQGELVNKECHTASTAGIPVACQNAASRPATLGGRVAFSPEDDRILVACVKDAARHGQSILGNVLYQELAAKVRGRFVHLAIGFQTHKDSILITPTSLGVPGGTRRSVNESSLTAESHPHNHQSIMTLLLPSSIPPARPRLLRITCHRQRRSFIMRLPPPQSRARRPVWLQMHQSFGKCQCQKHRKGAQRSHSCRDLIRRDR